ncbi:hypothetical protein CS542_06740 [Pedobacter sp. IW39]|nr:hypothetical protein CS542_06740 [Pedobacter sp. IW39]
MSNLRITLYCCRENRIDQTPEWFSKLLYMQETNWLLWCKRNPKNVKGLSLGQEKLRISMLILTLKV